MSVDSKKVLEIVQIAGVSIGLVAIGAGGSWNLYKDNVKRYKDEIASYEKAKDMNLPSLMENLSSVTVKLEQRLSLINDHDALKNKVEQLENSNVALSEALEVNTHDYQSKIIELEEKLSTQKDTYEARVLSLQEDVDKLQSEVTSLQSRVVESA